MLEILFWSSAAANTASRCLLLIFRLGVFGVFVDSLIDLLISIMLSPLLTLEGGRFGPPGLIGELRALGIDGVSGADLGMIMIESLLFLRARGDSLTT